MQTFKIAASIVVALLLQILFAKRFSFFQYVELPLVITVFFSLQRSPIQGMFVGMAAGLGLDIVSGGDAIGVRGFSFTLLGYVIAMGSIRFSLEQKPVRILVTAVASIANTVLFVGLCKVLEKNVLTNGPDELLKLALYKAIGDTAAGLILFILLDRIFPRTGSTTIKRRFYE